MSQEIKKTEIDLVKPMNRKEKMLENNEKLIEPEFSTTPYRWVILVSIMLCIISGTVSCTTLSPVAL